MLHPRGDDINAGGVYAGMTQDVCQADDVPLHGVKQPGEQVPQVMGEDLLLRHPRRCAR